MDSLQITTEKEQCGYPSYQTHEKGHILDQIFSNDKIVTSVPVPLVWSDHFYIDFTIENVQYHRKSQGRPHSRSFRSFSQITAEALTAALSNHPIPSNGNVEDDADGLDSWLQLHADELAPPSLQPAKVSHASAPWFTEALRERKSACKCLERAWRKNFDPNDKKTNKQALKLHYKKL